MLTTITTLASITLSEWHTILINAILQKLLKQYRNEKANVTPVIILTMRRNWLYDQIISVIFFEFSYQKYNLSIQMLLFRD